MNKLYHIHELVWVVAETRQEAAQYLVMDGFELSGCEWSDEGDEMEDWLTLVHPDSDVALPDPEDGELYAQTAREYAAGCPIGHVVDDR